MKWTGLLFFSFFFLASLFSRCGGDSDLIDTVAVPLPAAVNQITVADSYYNRKVQLKTRVFYRANGLKRTWLKKRRPDKMFLAFSEEVKASHRYGFDPESYHMKELEEAVKALYDNRKRTPGDISALDIRITASFFLFTTHLIEGRVRHPGAREFFWERGMPLENDIALLLEMESASDLRKELDNLHPKDPQYGKLQQALKKYRELQEKDSLPQVPANINLKPGDKHDAVDLVRRKLALTDYRSNDAQRSRVYDDELVKAVKNFQTRHGLDPDGVVDAETARFINIPLKEKADLISLNLERLRWRPHLKGEGPEIVINVPEYMLRVYRDNKEEMEMRVVLGAEYTPTPVFQDTLKYIVFSPTWIVPASIFEEEFFPKLKEDPGHFDPESFRFYKARQEIDPTEEDWSDKKIDLKAYQVIENPGERNSLGKVKFIMPNDFSVYLHDTPADQLFQREDRALSHGCIRLEDPQAFAAYLLSDKKGWDEDNIRQAMNSDKPVKVDLDETYPVYIVYRTAWVDEDDQVHFREDIYGHDQRHLAMLR